MVFIFFGGVSVLGSFPLFAKVFDWNLVYASISIGLFSTAVLNLNNMRDRTNDAQSNKRTLVVMMGPNAAKLYHFFLVCGGIAFLTIFIGKTNHEMAGLGLLPSVLFIFHSRKVMQTKNPKEYDQELKKIALYTFLSSALTALGLLLN
jgi:1,4-dihydroxy-2-naphthoate octaprenyltransferase